WTLADVSDLRVLLKYFGPIFRRRVLAQLRREYTVNPLAEATRTRFAAAGFPLHASEAVLIAKTMAQVLEYAAPKLHNISPLTAGTFDLTPVLAGTNETLALPRWSRALLRLIA